MIRKLVVLDCQCHSFDDVERVLCRVISRIRARFGLLGG